MGEIHVHEFMSLDGVIDAPTWTAAFGFAAEMAEVVAGITGASTGILLGRTTYEMFAPAWSSRSAADDPGAPFFNETPKYVVSSSLAAPSWANTHVIGPYDREAIERLKTENDGNVYMSGSGTLVRALLADHLVDALHLFVYPLTRGGGPRLFPSEPLDLQLAACESYANGVAYLCYRPQH